uniref:Uncharacterized protein n=1 Tax=Acrobeloides nanus TaxID=290746 RepID=A0A914D8I7_9BILA
MSCSRNLNLSLFLLLFVLLLFLIELSESSVISRSKRQWLDFSSWNFPNWKWKCYEYHNFGTKRLICP